MINSTGKILVTAMAVLSCAVFQSCDKDPFKQLAGITTIPDFSVMMSTGETVNILTLYGTAAVICTFDLDNVYSQKMLSVMQSIYSDYGRKVKFVLIGSGDSEDDIKSYWSRHGYTLPYSPQDDDGEAKKFSSTPPHMIVCDKSLTIKGEYDGFGIPTRTALAKLLDSIIN